LPRRQQDELRAHVSFPASVLGSDKATEAAREASRLIFVEIFLGNIVFGYFAGANLLIIVSSAFHAVYDIGLKGIAFLEQFAHTLRISSFNVGQSL
jgi:nucleoside permease NupC